MMAIDLGALGEELLPVVRAAGRAIMEVHAAAGADDRRVHARTKSDGSPVTEADEAAEALILPALRELAPGVTIISEENAASHQQVAPDQFFLVDPLDGTKEFLKTDDKGAFTVNIGLIAHGVPILGVVFAPARNRLFLGMSGNGAFEITDENRKAITVRAAPATGPVAVASASHRDAETNAWLADHAITQTVAIGSSLKFCLVAAGEADVYPRFGPTMEWDTAAGDAILRAAGGRVDLPDGSAFRYGKPDYRNGPFIAWGHR